MWRGVRNCPFWPALRDLAQHVLVHVALGVAVFHWDVVEHVHDLGEQGGRRDCEAGVLHVAGIRGVLPIRLQGADEREHAVAYDRIHGPRIEVLEAAPAQVFVRNTAVVLAFGKDAPLQGTPQAVGLLLLGGMEVVEALDEEEVRDLVHHFQRVGDAARPEHVPQAVYLAFEFSGDHK